MKGRRPIIEHFIEIKCFQRWCGWKLGDGNFETAFSSDGANLLYWGRHYYERRPKPGDFDFQPGENKYFKEGFDQGVTFTLKTKRKGNTT